MKSFRIVSTPILALVILALVCFITFRWRFFTSVFVQPVQTISTEQLRQHIFDRVEADGIFDTSANFVLVDVRSPEEQAVSLIPGAITAEEFEQTIDYRSHEIIVYCTIGVRSERYARQLVSEGLTVKNYKASIIGWCNANCQLVAPNGEPTKRVHTYSAQFEDVPAGYTAVY